MKNILFTVSILVALFLLSLWDRFFISIVLLLGLFLFVTYMYLVSRKRKLHILTIAYVCFSFSFVAYALSTLLNSNNFVAHSFVTVIILSIMTPTFFLLAYRIILSIHCFIDSMFFSNVASAEHNNLVQNKGCSIVITTRNEPFDVCKMTFDSAYELDYPYHLKEIVVVDNSELSHDDFTKWQEYVNEKNMLNGINSKFIHRNGTEGFKSRNLDIAMDNISFEYVLFLDADSTLPKDALREGLAEFNKDSKLGFVNFLIESTNYETNFVTKVTSIFQNTIRYFNEFVGKHGYCNYQGHNGIWSVEALQATSKWEEYHKNQVMFTEDIAAGFRCYAAGFTSKPVFLKTGEWVPISLKEFEKMWLRWSFGGMQVMNKYLWTIIRSRNLYFRVKLDMLYLLFKVVASGFPIFALLLVIFPRNDLGFVVVVNFTLLPLFMLSVWYYLYGYIKGGFLSKIGQIYTAMFMLSSFVFWCVIKAEINYYLNKSQSWKPTSKTFEKSDSWAAVLYNNAGKLIFSSVGLILSIFSIFRFFSSDDFELYFLCMVPSILLFLNTILCVVILGRSKA